jgi:hypothetical protein
VLYSFCVGGDEASFVGEGGMVSMVSIVETTGSCLFIEEDAAHDILRIYIKILNYKL